MGSTEAPLFKGLNQLVQTSDNMSASNSEDNRDPDQDTDNPLPNQGHANAAQPGDTAEDYVPWFGDSLEDLGLIPRFLASEFIGGVVYLLAFVTICIPVIFFDRTSHAIFNMSAVDFLIGRCFNAIVASVNWSPLIAVCWFLLSYPQPNKFTKAVIVIGACLFGLLSWGYCALVSSEKHGLPWDITIGQLFETWSTGTVPQSFRGCDTRVEPNQAPLFETDIYYTQFARTWHTLGNFTVDDMFHTAYDMERFSSIQANQTLCAQGFEGNNDLYGLGLRTSLYVQWLSSFLANNFLPGTRQNLQIAYLIFSLAICLATIISSFIQACVFSIEIEIMYWMYWGGYVCVFAAAPCPVRLGSDIKWIKLDWITAILFTTHILMIYHGVWFVFDAYDQVFSRMPCGTYHFFLFPILDPSEGFWTLRDYLTNLLIPFVPALLAIYPVVGLALASEVKYTIQNSTIYQTLFLKPTVSDRDQRQTTVHNAFVKISPVLRAYLFITRLYRRFREFLGFPSHRGGGIRLVTPIDVRDRRFVAYIDYKIFAER